MWPGVVGLKAFRTRSRKAAWRPWNSSSAGLPQLLPGQHHEKAGVQATGLGMHLHRGSQRGGERLHLKRQWVPLPAPEHPG